MAEDLVVVGPAAGVYQKQSAAVHHPVLLRVVAAQFRPVIKGPRLCLPEVQAVRARGHVALLVVPHRQEEATAEPGQRGLAEPRDIDRQPVAVFDVSAASAVEPAADDRRSTPVLGPLKEIAQNPAAARSTRCAARPGAANRGSSGISSCFHGSQARAAGSYTAAVCRRRTGITRFFGTRRCGRCPAASCSRRATWARSRKRSADIAAYLRRRRPAAPWLGPGPPRSSARGYESVDTSDRQKEFRMVINTTRPCSGQTPPADAPARAWTRLAVEAVDGDGPSIRYSSGSRPARCWAGECQDGDGDEDCDPRNSRHGNSPCHAESLPAGAVSPLARSGAQPVTIGARPPI